MTLKKIRVTNFKSFENLDVELGKFNVVIGVNASGKSNFIQIFKFMKDITNYGIDNAISMQGGIEYLRNINIDHSKDFSLEFIFDQKFSRVVEKKTEIIGIKTYETIYNLTLKFKNEGRGFEIVEDKISQKCDFVRLEKTKKMDEKKKFDEKEKFGEGEITVFSSNGKIKVNLSLPDRVQLKEEDIFPPFLKDEILRDEKLEPKSLLLQFSFFFMPPFFGDFSIYDFDPKLPKKAIPITGKADLEEDGSNLAIVLKNIIDDEEKKRKLSNLVRDILPFVENLDVDKFADKSLLFKLQEIYSKTQYLPASLISDGTINITAIIIALYFEKKPITIIEEPERNIHPYLISKLVDMMKDASQNKQIIVTTHNPELIKNASIENIILVSRNKEGFSIISKPSEKKEIQIFLENEMGIEELYLQNLLEF